MDYNPVTTTKGPNYVFYFNDGTKLGEVHIHAMQIPLAEADATMFARADEPARQQLLKRLVEAYEARVRARKAAPR
jgi:hypothetical protein